MFDSDAKSSAASRGFFLKEKKKEKFKERRKGRIGLEAELLLLLLFLRYMLLLLLLFLEIYQYIDSIGRVDFLSIREIYYLFIVINCS